MMFPSLHRTSKHAKGTKRQQPKLTENQTERMQSLKVRLGVHRIWRPLGNIKFPQIRAHVRNGVKWFATRKINGSAGNPANWVLEKLKRGQTYWDRAPKLLGMGRLYIPNGNLSKHEAYMARCAKRRAHRA